MHIQYTLTHMQSAADLYILVTFVIRGETASTFISFSFDVSWKALTSGEVFKLCLA